MSRQTVFAAKVLPPFEIVEFPSSFVVKMKVSGDIINVTVPVEQFNSEEDYLKHLEDTIKAVKDSIVLAKAEKVELVEKIEEEEMDEFSMKLQAKALQMEEE
jgi:formate dehydrogenase maturation protein FdhE